MATTEAVDVVMPQMGVSVSEGTITKWLKQVGEEIEADESLLEISTDKVDTEVPSPASGVVTQILVQEGETVDVGTKLAVIGGEARRARRGSAAQPEPEAQRRGRGVAAAAPRHRPSNRRRRLSPRHARLRQRRPRPSRTARASSRRSSRGSPPSTASTSRASRARAAADA